MLNILVVDDDRNTRMFLEAVLKKANYTVFLAENGLAALPFGQAVLMVGVSVGLTLISGLIPANAAANKDPVIARRTE